MNKLKISDDLTLPIDGVTQTFAVLAKRGVGKTYTASVMAEEMLKANQQIVTIDPTGAWWGLRTGYPVVIIGGEHADVPLEESAGEVVAQAIVENRFPAVIDLSLFRKGQMIRFMVTFAETLYRLNRDPVHLFVDEADAVAPQAKNYGGDENRMLGAMEDIVRRGRKRGIGCTLITQRPAVLNKNVLTQCEILISMRLVHPKDIDAIEEWVNVHADPVQAKAMIDSLPSLPVGTAWFWSPGWGDIFKRVKIRERETFDSSATPKPGERQKQPKTLRPIDIDALGQQIKSTVQRAKENDPKELKREVARLTAELAKRPAATEKIKRVEVPLIKDSQIKAVESVVTRLEREGRQRVEVAQELKELAQTLQKSGEDLAARSREFTQALSRASAPSPHIVLPHETRSTAPAVVTVRRLTPAEGSEVGSAKGERAVMIAIAQEPGADREYVTVQTGYKRSTRDAYIQRLAKDELIRIGFDGLHPTDKGLAWLGDFKPLPTGSALREWWLARLPEGERKCLEVVLERAGHPVDREHVGERTGYKRSTRDAYLQRLGNRRLVGTSRDGVFASRKLFDVGEVSV